MKAAALLAALAVSASADCEDLASIPSDAARNLDVKLLAGTFYEQEYYDLAQAGASCQRMTNTVNEDGTIAQNFEAKYGALPFTLPLTYTPTAPGLFARSAFHLGDFPSAVVDVSFAEDGSVAALSEYLCTSVGGLTYEEVRVSTRDRTADPALLAAQEKALAAAGLNRTLAAVDQSACGAGHLETTTGKCCETCNASLGLAKYWSTDGTYDHCGEACIPPSQFWLYKIFEKNLTLAEEPHPCKDKISNNGSHYTEYSQTVSHGIPYIFTATLDLYDPGPV